MARNPIRGKCVHPIFAAILLTAFPGSIKEAAAKKLQVYHNEPFGFSVVVPPRLHPCLSSNATTDHGMVIPLKMDAPCDGNQDSMGPSIGVFAAFNAAYEADTAYELAKHVCDDSNGRTLVQVRRARKALSFKGKDTFTCTKIWNGEIVLHLVTLIGRTTSPESGTEVAIDLYSTRARLNDDIKVLKAVVSSLTFDRPKS